MLKLKRADLILIAVVLVLVGGILGYRALFPKAEASSSGGLAARITVDGKLYKLVPLTKEEQVLEMYTDYGHDTLKVFNNGIQMTYSDTPLKIGMKMGFISRPGEQIICLPHRIFVEIVQTGEPSEDQDDQVDAIVN